MHRHWQCTVIAYADNDTEGGRNFGQNPVHECHRQMSANQERDRREESQSTNVLPTNYRDSPTYQALGKVLNSGRCRLTIVLNHLTTAIDDPHIRQLVSSHCFPTEPPPIRMPIDGSPKRQRKSMRLHQHDNENWDSHNLPPSFARPVCSSQHPLPSNFIYIHSRQSTSIPHKHS